MAGTRAKTPAIDGWFTTPTDGSDPKLIGVRCTSCGTYVFPPRAGACPNPACDSDDLAPVELSSRGRVWSYAENHYPPPAPYVPADPFEPYALAAVELEAEGLIVLGQVAEGVPTSDLHVGMPMKLDLGVLYSDDDNDYLVYTWAPDVKEDGK